MQLRISLVFFCLAISLAGIAQANGKKEQTISKKDSLRLAKLNARGMYPAIKNSKFCGVLPVAGITEKPDSTMKYKLLISLSLGTSDADKVKELNEGLAEAGRIINLHLAAGVPKENLQVVIVVHGPAINTVLNNGAFNKEFKANNPNVAIIKELENAGAVFVACGQSMQYHEIKNEELLPDVKVALSAKVALSTYQLKGYVLYEIEDE